MSIINNDYFGSFVDQLVGTNGLVGPGGIHAGDPFSGTFSYDSSASPISTSPSSATYEANSFTVTLPNAMLLGTNQPTLRVSTDPQDPSIQVFGKLPCNLFMGLLLRGPGDVISNTSLPVHIKLSSFLIKHFTICDDESALFGYAQTPVPPPGAQVFLRGELNELNKVKCLSILTGLLGAKYSIHRRRATGA